MAGSSKNLKLDNKDFGDSSDDYEVKDNDDTAAGNDDDVLSLSLEKLSIGRPKKKLLVLGYGLLLQRVFSNKRATIPLHRCPDGKFGKNYVFKRPFADQFMSFCFEKFQIGIWSTTQKHNIERLLDCAMEGLREELLFVWNQQECTDTGFMSLENKSKPLFVKELKKIWNNDDNKLPFQSGTYSSKNTLLIDDNPYGALLNPPNTSIFPETYDPNDVDDDALDPKGELCQFLDGLAEAEDVQAFVEEHPFGQPAVTPMHPDWAFYSMVLRRLSKQYDASRRF